MAGWWDKAAPESGPNAMEAVMNKRFLLNAALGAALALGLPAAAHAEDALARVKASGTLKIGTETAFAPFDYIDAGNHAGSTSISSPRSQGARREDRMGRPAMGRRAAGPRGRQVRHGAGPATITRPAWNATASCRPSPRPRWRS